jgi:hypothetical protein
MVCVVKLVGLGWDLLLVSQYYCETSRGSKVRHLGHISSNVKGSNRSHRNSYQRTLFATCDVFQQIIKEPMRKRQGVGQIPFDQQLKKMQFHREFLEGLFDFGICVDVR